MKKNLFPKSFYWVAFVLNCIIAIYLAMEIIKTINPSFQNGNNNDQVLEQLYEKANQEFQLADTEESLGRAIGYLLQAVIIEEKNPKEYSSLLRETYVKLAVIYQTTEDYINALKYYKKFLNTIKKSNKNREYISIYSNIAVIYFLMGNYDKALLNFEISVSEKSKSLNNDVRIDIDYSYMTSIYQNLGNFNEALKYAKLTLKIRKKYFGMFHQLTAIAYNNIGLAYHNIRGYKNADYYYQLATDVCNKVSCSDQISSQINMNRSGVFSTSLSLEKRFKDTEKFISVQEKNNNMIELAGGYNNLGMMYLLGANYSKADYFLSKALALKKQFLGYTHHDVGFAYLNLGYAFNKSKEYSKAYKYTNKSLEIFFHNRDKNFVILDNKQKKMYLTKNEKKLPLLLDISYQYAESNNSVKVKVSQETLNNWLNYKGAIFDSENAIITLYQNTKDEKLKEKVNDLISQKRVLAKLYQTLPKPEESDRWKEKIKKTESKIAELTNQIASKVKILKEQQGLKNIQCQDIAKNLKANELYLDYAKAGDYYYLFSLDKKKNITFNRIDENKTKEIDILVQSFRDDIQSILQNNTISKKQLDELTLASKEKLSKLYTLTLKEPLEDQLKQYKSLIISTDGALKLLPFDSMYDKTKDQYLIEQKEVRYIPSGKELVRLYKYGQNIHNASNKTVIFSNPNFDARDKLASVSQEEISVTPNTSRSGIIKSLFKMQFNPLPGTKEEARSIEETLKNTETIKKYSQEAASEANLMNVKEPKILHIATHGFFLNDKNIPNPMLKSGIALSGANTSAIKGTSDGIVTALKLSGLNLKGTDLVVLSACETGVVDINDTQSVSGLSKAFMQAGAKDIVMSLWSVDDQATKELMSSFYRKMQKYPSYNRALKEAKLDMIKENRHPFYWAAFVLNGL